MKNTISCFLILSVLLIFSCQSSETNACAEHKRECPPEEKCLMHFNCEEHEKCEKDKDCKKHSECVAFEKTAK